MMNSWILFQEIFDGLLVRFENYNEIVGKVERIPKSSCGREKRRNFEDENGAIRVEVRQFLHLFFAFYTKSKVSSLFKAQKGVNDENEHSNS